MSVPSAGLAGNGAPEVSPSDLLSDPDAPVAVPLRLVGAYFPLELARICTEQSADGAFYTIAKRALDLSIGTIAFLVALPFIVFLAILVKLDSKGPAIFRQQRVGRNGVPFTFYKFRTMWVDARELYPELYAYRYTEGEISTMYFKLIDDPRLTRVGRHLRRTSLDELPNLINVLTGEMSLVGPRPELPDMLPYYTPEQLVKFTMKPGVTGLAQVCGRSLLRFQETNQTDVEYYNRRSFWADLVILARTVKCVILRVGAF